MIPAELRERHQWVIWRRETRDGKTTKVPYQANDPSRRASTTDPATWSSYEDAEAASVLDGDGIGYVFTDDDPYVGIDLDAGLPESDRGAIMVALDSYSEESVSGTGAHVIVKASLNGHGRNRKGPVEIYEHGRYFVMTGRHITGTPETIEERQEQLEQVLAHFLPPDPKPDPGTRPPVVVDVGDQELLELAFRSKSGPEIEALYRGDTSRHSDDRSAADLALCAHLAFWAGRDPVRIDRLFRSSGLYRDKWDDRRGETTYGALTIEKAIEGCADVYEPRARRTSPAAGAAESPPAQPTDADAATDVERPYELVPLDWAPILATGLPEIEYVLEPYLPARKRIWAAGAAEAGKSILAAHWAATLTRAGLVVVYVSQENGLEEEARRFVRLRPDFANLRLFVDQGLDLKIPRHAGALIEAAQGAALVVIDTLTACWSGDEDSNKEIAAFDRDVLLPIVHETGASPLVLDHTGNPQPFVRRRGVSVFRGASAKGQKADHVLEIRATGDNELTIDHGKARGARKQPPRTYRVIDTDDDGLDLIEIETSTDEKAAALADQLVEIIRDDDGITTKKLREAAKGLGGTDLQTAAMKLLEAEEPPRVTAASETVDTGKGRQRAKVWRLAPNPLFEEVA